MTYALGFQRHWRYSTLYIGQLADNHWTKRLKHHFKNHRADEPRLRWWKLLWYKNSSIGELLRVHVKCFDHPCNYCHVARRLDVESEGRPSTPGRLVTLRVKSETGDEVRQNNKKIVYVKLDYARVHLRFIINVLTYSRSTIQ